MTTQRKSWKRLEDRLLQKTVVFDLRVQRMLSPDEKVEDDFYYIQTLDWVNVIPVTPDKKVVLVEQYRHGINRFSLETPGGLVDDPPGDPHQTAVKELAEETGYESQEIIPLGTFHPNPAMLTNTCHVYLAKNAVPTAVQNLEPAEDITIHLCPIEDIPGMIGRGEISHAVVSAAFFLLLKHLNNGPGLFSKL